MRDRFELPPELNIYCALELRDALLAWASKPVTQAKDYLEVSARNVIEVDGAGLQLLAALSNGAQSWHLVEASPVFEDACRTMGVGHWLDKRYFQAGTGEA